MKIGIGKSKAKSINLQINNSHLKFDFLVKKASIFLKFVFNSKVADFDLTTRQSLTWIEIVDVIYWD